MTGSGDFQALFQRGTRVDRPSLIVLWAEAPARRVGFAVSRQVRGAVKRNRVRRRLREAAPENAAMVVIGRPRAALTEFVGLVSELRAAFLAIPSERASA